jgi:hypothetical protein
MSTSVHPVAWRMPMLSVRPRSYLVVIGIPPREADRKESDAMFHPNQLRTGEPLPIAPTVASGACLVAGCTCKDARIISYRHAAFVAAMARSAGETADREIAPDPAWRIPTFEGA